VKLLLVRHGETEWNKLGKFQGQQDIAMNARGLAQAQETARAVAAEASTCLYSSPLCRTMQVAEEISRFAGPPVVPVPGLKELDLGDLEGVTGQEMRTRWPEVYAAWRKDPSSVVMPNGESLVQLQDRAWQSVLEMEQAHSDSDTLVIVSHNFTIRTIIGKVLGMPLTNFHRMTLDLSSICTLESNDGSRRLVCYNSTSHLSPSNR
jgi:broad specificity phosphatase PhoE